MSERKIMFNFPVFFLTFVAGLLYVYLFTPHKQVVVKYPNPFNANKVLYHGDGDACYKYNVEKVKCPEDTSKILDHPVV